MKKLMLIVGLSAFVALSMPAMADVVTVDQFATAGKVFHANDVVLNDQAGTMHESAFAVNDGAAVESYPALQVYVAFGNVHGIRLGYVEPSRRAPWHERMNL